MDNSEHIIRLRVGIAVVKNDQILLIPHYDTDVGPIQWVIPAGRLEFGESLEAAAQREFEEETGLQAEISGLLDISEVVLPEQPWHSVTITYSGHIVGGTLRAEPNHAYGDKTPRWLSKVDLANTPYHPAQTVNKALGLK